MIKSSKLSTVAFAIAAGAALFSGPAVQANPVKIDYQQPAQEIIDIVDAASSPGGSLSPDGDLLMITKYPALPDITDVSAEQLKLAGRRINPANYTVSQARYISALELVDVATGDKLEIKGLPTDLKALGASWSPNGDYIAVAQQTPASVQLWLVDVAKAEAKLWSSAALNAVWGPRLEWRHDSSGLYSYTVADDLVKPAMRTVPSGPVITESAGRTAPGRTYQDLLLNKQDEALFDYYFTSQITFLRLLAMNRKLVRRQSIAA